MFSVVREIHFLDGHGQMGLKCLGGRGGIFVKRRVFEPAKKAVQWAFKVPRSPLLSISRFASGLVKELVKSKLAKTKPYLM